MEQPPINKKTLQQSLVAAVCRRDAIREQQADLDKQLLAQDREIQALQFGLRCLDAAAAAEPKDGETPEAPSEA